MNLEWHKMFIVCEEIMHFGFFSYLQNKTKKKEGSINMKVISKLIYRERGKNNFKEQLFDKIERTY